MTDWNMEGDAARACMPLLVAPSQATETPLGLALPMEPPAPVETAARAAAPPERAEEVA